MDSRRRRRRIDNASWSRNYAAAINCRLLIALRCPHVRSNNNVCDMQLIVSKEQVYTLGMKWCERAQAQFDPFIVAAVERLKWNWSKISAIAATKKPTRDTKETNGDCAIKRLITKWIAAMTIKGELHLTALGSSHNSTKAAQDCRYSDTFRYEFAQKTKHWSDIRWYVRVWERDKYALWKWPV